MLTAEALRARALEEGFSAIGICSPGDVAAAGRRLREWVAAGRHGSMAWMERRLDWRADPRVLWPAVRSIVMLGENYGPAGDPLAVLGQRDRGAISVYAQNRDYHDIVKKRLKRLGRWMIDRAPGAEIKVFVDTAPVMEKPLAAAAGLGWQGKHTNLVSRDFGSWLFLGAIFTTLDLPRDGAGADHCGQCRACIDACPTGAITAPYQLDARLCISYLTIEHAGPVAPRLRPLVGNRIYGCDDCLAVCPWNKFAQEASEAGYHARAELQAPPLARLAGLDDGAFRALFRKSPIKRIGVMRFLRNVGYAIGNSQDIHLVDAAHQLARHDDPTVRDAGEWALWRLNGQASEGERA